MENSYFQTERRRRQLERWKQRQAEGAEPTSALDFGLPDGERKHGTVGAVALDAEGHLAAATSTGGMTGKRWGRIGDSPIVGAGTWAEDATCAVSGTGWGEFFIRGTVARDVAARMEFQDLSLEQAAQATIEQRLDATGGTGGVIALDAQGRVACPFNTPGMYRGWIDQKGQVTTLIYAE